MEITIIRRKFLNIQVCTTGTNEEATEWINRTEPSGTTNGWVVSEEHPPVWCEAWDGHRHILFDC